MATPIKRIEKEFLLKVLYDEQIPVRTLRDRSEYILTLTKPARTEMEFRADRPIGKLKARSKLDMMFDYWGQVITFSVVINIIRDDVIVCDIPESLYKNLNRSYMRINMPQDIQVQLSFLGDHKKLSFPEVMEYELGEISEFFRNIDPKDLTGLVAQMAEWVKNYASGYKLVVFKDNSPVTVDEHIIVETGRILYLPSTADGFPKSDPYPHKRIITQDMFKIYLESTGVDLADIEEACARYIMTKRQNGILSDAWIPLLFQEYVFGYIHVWINTRDKPPFNNSLIDILHEFTKVLSYSFQINGYFEKGKLNNKPDKVIDISASGLLFACSHTSRSSALLSGNELKVMIITAKRTINAVARIVRRYKDASMNYFGCSFTGMEPEDMRFLFEFLYGKPFTDADAKFFTGQV